MVLLSISIECIELDWKRLTNPAKVEIVTKKLITSGIQQRESIIQTRLGEELHTAVYTTPTPW